ncbi:MAG TPA: M28 family metallopeptidase [Gemmatimonadaceae bacterium]|nr:M28 family metallopeptidase [Gemmatimonadaceae bacterium]
MSPLNPSRVLPLAALVAAAAAVACSGGTSASGEAGVAPFPDSSAAAQPVAQAAEAITAAELLAHVRALSADSMEGRAPGTPGEVKTVAYLTRQFQEAGLQPGNPDGTWVQNVDMIGYSSHPTARVTVGGKPIPLSFPDDFVASSRHEAPATTVENSDIVFVGYGVVAPEYGWDDYKGVDVSGKTIIMLINDPAVPAPGAPVGDMERLDSTMFKGKAMTYYGRWTYKYEIASEKKAAAAMIVHETGPAGYPYDVVRGSFSAEQFDIATPGASARVPVEGWLSLDKAKAILAAAGYDFDSLKAAATRKDFQPVVLPNAKASFDVKVTTRRIQSKNVVGKLQGSSRPDEYVIYTAHWDHLGRDTTLKGDQIYNGALDNATGTSALIEIARAFRALPEPPARSILFLAVTAEEKGLLGAKYYAQHPLYPLAKTAADINIDGVNQWGRTRDLVVVGRGNSTLDDVLQRVLATSDRVIVPDAEPEKGFYYRSDHFEFAKQGVPALYVDAGTEYMGKEEGYGMRKREEFTARDYHKPSDEVKPDWDLSGAVEDLRALFRVGYIVAQEPRFPEWKEGTEFKARRDSSLAASRR